MHPDDMNPETRLVLIVFGIVFSVFTGVLIGLITLQICKLLYLIF